METSTKNLRIHGRVQGVGYRNWCVFTANNLRLTGWVRNRKDGTVEATATGSEDSLEDFIKACYQGPAAASVSVIEVNKGIDEELNSFEQRDTV